MKRFTGKVCVITGAGSGIGRATAVELSRRGAVVCVVDLNELTIAQTAASIRSSGGNAHAYTVDVSNREAIYGLAEQINCEHGAASLVMNNAGVMTTPRELDALTNDDIDWLMSVNLWGVINGTRAFLPQLRRHNVASIVNLSSVAGLIGMLGFTHYCTAKAGVRGFSDALRMDLFGTGISVTTVFPGHVATGIVGNARGYNEEERSAALKQVASLPHVTADAAALRIIRGIEKKRGRVLIGREAVAVDILTRFAPTAYVPLLHPIMKKYTSGITVPTEPH